MIYQDYRFFYLFSRVWKLLITKIPPATIESKRMKENKFTRLALFAKKADIPLIADIAEPVPYECDPENKSIECFKTNEAPPIAAKDATARERDMSTIERVDPGCLGFGCGCC